MKILHTSDWHLGKSLYDFSLLEDQTEFINHLLNLLGDHRVDAVILAGDIYDRPIPPAGAVQLFDHFLTRAVGKMGIPVLAIAGNHDSAARLEFGSSLYRQSGYYVVGTVQNPVQTVTLQDSAGPVCFSLFPYMHPAEVRALWEEDVRTFDNAYRTVLHQHIPTLDRSLRQVAIAHGFFASIGRENSLVTSESEVNVGGMDIADSGPLSFFDYVALGHLHAPQQSGDKLFYSGSPLKYSLSEEYQEKSVVLATLEQKGHLEVERIPLPCRRNLRTITGTLENLLEPSYHTNTQFDDYVFAQIQGEESLYPMQKLRTLFPHLLGLQFLYSQTQEPVLALKGDAVSRLSPLELFGRFYESCTNQELSPQHVEVLTKLLAEQEVEV